MKMIMMMNNPPEPNRHGNGHGNGHGHGNDDSPKLPIDSYVSIGIVIAIFIGFLVINNKLKYALRCSKKHLQRRKLR